ncbi:hypothetical protein [Litorilituus sediminis]|uniref:Uncharacterized protein n=1 Tax=Litorilituus sediminis TaxID=718192 RepID=A0A4V0ZG15_9GAMM|nr:hypothetical protein [Litorilituus sediminis]QBG35720.1 hypothetical protein EMK97_08350 [Litorilituus sediminis]
METKLLTKLATFTSSLKRGYTFAVITLLLTNLSACQITPQAPASFSYSQYYLWLKTLNAEELVTELAQQKQALNSQESQQTKVKLLLLHTLPSSPEYQPYKAKTLLNQVPLSASQFNSEQNLAFMLLIKDLLNAQLLLIEKHQRQTDKDKQAISQFQQQINLLEQQLEQLKKIEQSINQQ